MAAKGTFVIHADTERSATVANNGPEISHKIRSEVETLVDAIRDADLDAVEGVFATLDDEELKIIGNVFAGALRSGKES